MLTGTIDRWRYVLLLAGLLLLAGCGGKIDGFECTDDQDCPGGVCLDDSCCPAAQVCSGACCGSVEEHAAEPYGMPYAGVSTQLGFNYWPSGYHNDCLWTSKWSACESIVRRDLDNMASAGARVIRFMFFPGHSGYVGRGSFTAELQAVRTNTPKLLDLLEDRGLKAIISFGNSYLVCKHDYTCDKAWGWVYKYCPYHDDCQTYNDRVAAFTEFLVDTKHWIDTIVGGIESSAAASTVLFYDYQNELRPRRYVWSDWYVNYLYDWSAIPAAKRGLSIIAVGDASTGENNENLIAARMGARKNGLRFTDFHANRDQDIAAFYQEFRSLFPRSTTILGEFSAGDVSNDEVLQQPIVLSKWNAAKSQGIPYALPWTWMNHGPRFAGQIFGLSWSWEAPKDVLGGMASALVMPGLSNPDMEIVNARNRPVGWFCAGSTCSSVGSAATNARALRASSTDCYGDLVVGTTGLASVTPPATLFANAYYRTNLRNVRLDVLEFDSSGTNLLRMTSSNPDAWPTWKWRSALWRTGEKRYPLLSGTRKVRVRVRGTKQCANPIQYLDVDTVTIHTIP